MVGGVSECVYVCRKSKILQHRSLQLVVYWKQARAPAPQVDQPLPRHCGKLGGLRKDGGAAHFLGSLCSQWTVSIHLVPTIRFLVNTVNNG